MAHYTVKELSALAGVSVRALHHYDERDLLKPRERSDAGYRYYGKAELLRLQQILFYKELHFSLAEIKQILDDPDFDLLDSLSFHKEELQKQSLRLQKLMLTIDKTIDSIKIKKDMITDKEMYEGFSEEEKKANRKEVIDRWGEDKLLESENNIRKMGKDAFTSLKKEGEEITAALGTLITEDPGSKKVQELIALHYQHMNKFYSVSEEIYRGLGKMYVEDERFTIYYEKYQEGLAAFVNRAIIIFCDNGMKV